MDFVLLLNPEEAVEKGYDGDLLKMFHVMDRRESTFWKKSGVPNALNEEQKAKTLTDRWVDKTKILLVVNDEKEAVGFVEYTDAIYVSGINWLSICYLYVKREYRKVGYGKALLNYVRILAKHLNVDQVALSVNVKNVGAQRFYQKQGFIEQTKYLCVKP